MSRILVFICLINIAWAMGLATRHADQHGKSRNKRQFIKPQNMNQQEELRAAPLSLNYDNVARFDMNHLKAQSTESAPKDSKPNNVTSDTTQAPQNSGDKKETVQNHVINIVKKQPAADSEALLRGFYVFIGLSVATLLYVMYRSYRIRIGNNRPTTVRKYGILTQRTDMEMLPLPLDDEEDDDTVFDVGNHTNR